MPAKKECTGTIYVISGKRYCVGERKMKVKRGQTIRLRSSKTSKKGLSRKNRTKRRH